MKTLFANHPIARRVARRSSGFTVVELMIAMLLGLIVIAGVSSVFLANQRAYSTNTALAHVESNSRIAYELMARDIRKAGLTGCNSANPHVANVLNNAGLVWWADWSNAVHGFDATQADPAVPIGTAETQRVAGTDSLIVLGALGAGVSVEVDNSPSANFKINEKTTNLGTGDIIMVCDSTHATIVQITKYNDHTVTVVHNTGNKVEPGNCSKGLGYPTVCTATGNTDKFDRNSRIAKLGAHDWYIGVNPVGGRSLYRVNLSTLSETPTAQPQEMVRNVTNMQITYLARGDASIDDAYQTATTIETKVAWPMVTAVRVTLSLQSNSDHATVNGDDHLERKYAFTTALRNRLN